MTGIINIYFTEHSQLNTVGLNKISLHEKCQTRCFAEQKNRWLVALATYFISYKPTSGDVA